MRHKFRLMCVSLAVLWMVPLIGATSATETEKVSSKEHRDDPTITTPLPDDGSVTARLPITDTPDRSFGKEKSFANPNEPSDAQVETRISDYVCECLTSYRCTCKNSTGKLVYPDKYTGDTTWTFEVDSPSPILIKIFFWAADVPTGSKPWNLTIGSSVTLDQSSADVRNKTYVYIKSDETVVFDGFNNDYDMVLYYEALVPEHVTEKIPNDIMSGVIRFPTNTSDDDPDEGYPEQLRQMWVFDYPSNYIIALNLTKVDLGYRQSDLHWVNTFYSEIDNDFLLIGVGTEIMETIDKVFFGHLDQVETIRINDPTGHVVMFSSYHEQYAGGIEITFNALEVTIPLSTSTVAPTTAVPNLGVMPSTVAPIDGARQDGNDSAISIMFRSAVADMATEYMNSQGIQVQAPNTVEFSDVKVHWMGTCLQDTCTEDCAAFNFSITKMDKSGSAWAFTTPTLETMIRQKDLQHYWTYINEDCEFCEESVSVNWYVFGGVAAGAVLLAVIISLAVWKIRNVVAAKKSKQEVEEDLKQEELERRRRSSGDESVIGAVKGGARMSLPFGATRGSVGSAESSQEGETDEYPEHDPDFGYDTFGLGADLLNDTRARNFYSNQGFEPDADLPSTSFSGLPLKPTPILKSSLKKRRSPEESDETSGCYQGGVNTTPKKVITVVEEEDEDSFTESDDSDGTIQFKSAAFGPRKQISIKADVHRPGADIGETML